MSEKSKVYSIDKITLVKILESISDVLNANEQYLTKLDADIGDADHGINMSRGFQKVIEMLKKEDLSKADISRILNITGMALLQVVGGAAGPLYGMAFIEASKQFKNKDQMKVNDFVNLLDSALNAIKRVGGGTKVGEKTMVDVLEPVVERAKELVSNKNDIDFIELLTELVRVAKENVKKTIPLVAKKGRASYLGERSAGHQDPGATSTYLILRTFLDVLEGKRGVKIVEYDNNSGEIIKEDYLS